MFIDNRSSGVPMQYRRGNRVFDDKQRIDTNI